MFLEVTDGIQTASITVKKAAEEGKSEFAVIATVPKEEGQEKEVQKDIADHLAMADAHTTAAKCLQSGKSEKECHAQLAKDCKGLGIGKLCGMQHKH